MSLLYLIDGYNIVKHPLFIRKDNHAEGPQRDLSKLIKTKRLTGSTKNKVIIVFDGYPAQDNRANDASDFSVVFSRKISADDKIKMLVEESANRKNIIVVSDDREIKFSAKSQGAHVVSVEEFICGKDKKVSLGSGKNDSSKPELTYSLMHEINRELRKLWLK